MVIAKVVDGNDLAPLFAGPVVAHDVVGRCVAEESDIETRAIVRREHGCEQLHGRVVVPEVGRDIADTDAVVPGMWHGAAGFRQSGREGTVLRAGNPVQPFVAAPGDMVIGRLGGEDIRLAEPQRSVDVAAVFLDFGKVVCLAGIDEIGGAQCRVLGVRLEEICDGLTV
ncbi:hypothetical protein D9M68_829830 [compost metagenome]